MVVYDFYGLFLQSAQSSFYKVKTFLSYFGLKTHLFIFSERDIIILRSSHKWCSIEKLSLRFRNIQRKTPVLESLFNKFAGPQACNFVKKRLQHRCFLANITKF